MTSYKMDRFTELEQHFQTAVAPATTAALESLLAAVQRGDVVRGQYLDLTDGHVRGCLFYWVYGLRSRADREAMFRDLPHVFEATERIIAAWDHCGMEPSLVARLLCDELKRRQAINAEEDSAIRAVQRRIRRKNESREAAAGAAAC